MVQVNFYDSVEDGLLKFAVIAASYEGKWVFCKHKERDTYECPGGHREPGENIEDTAKRELYEETGALEFELEPVCVYAVERDGDESFGMLFLAKIHSFGELPSDFEMERIRFFGGQGEKEDWPQAWTYPEIQPYLLKRAGNALLTAEGGCGEGSAAQRKA